MLQRLFAPDFDPGRSVLWPRWIFLRGLGLIFFSVFYSLAFQIHGLIGPHGILPAGDYLAEVARAIPGLSRFGRAPTLLWLGSGDAALTALVGAGLIASVAPRAQPLAAGGARRLPRRLPLLRRRGAGLLLLPVGRHAAGGGVPLALLRAARPAARARRRMAAVAREPLPAPLGVVPHLLRVGHGEAAERRRAVARPHRHGPLLRERPAAVVDRLVRPAGLPHGFHAATAAATLLLELVVVWLAWLPRRVPHRLLPDRDARSRSGSSPPPTTRSSTTWCWCSASCFSTTGRSPASRLPVPAAVEPRPVPRWRTVGAAIVLVWIFYATVIPYVPAAGSRSPRRRACSSRSASPTTTASSR